MASYQSVENSLRGEPLYFFYDCEATGLDAKSDRIIEIASIVCTYGLNPRTARVLQQDDHQFTKLCYCTHPINPESAKVLTITLEDLKDAPRLEEVLKQFCDWIESKVSAARTSDRIEYTPVLVAHSGNLLDYPLLFNEIDRIGSYELKRKFECLNLHFADSYTAVRQLARSRHYFTSFPGLGIRDLHRGLLGYPHEGHRALQDAQALLNIFTQSERSKQSDLFAELRKLIISKQSVLFLRDQVPKFQAASINGAKAEQLLMKGVTYEKLQREYRISPRTFLTYLRSTCGIKHPKAELLEHFRKQ